MTQSTCEKPRILVVEDEEDLRRGLAVNLGRQGYEVLTAGTGEEAIDLTLRHTPHLVLLDVMLPGMSGIDVCRELRQKGIEVPIIMLTAKTEEIDRVVGLEIGADDYVTKPFSRAELLARIRARLRRLPQEPPSNLARYRFGDIDIDFEKLRATRDGSPLRLTRKEFEVLRFLIRYRGEVVSRDRMLDEVWGYDAYPTTRTVDTHILKLRKKIESDPHAPEYILSVYGGGYTFTD